MYCPGFTIIISQSSYLCYFVYFHFHLLILLPLASTDHFLTTCTALKFSSAMGMESIKHAAFSCWFTYYCTFKILLCLSWPKALVESFFSSRNFSSLGVGRPCEALAVLSEEVSSCQYYDFLLVISVAT